MEGLGIRAIDALCVGVSAMRFRKAKQAVTDYAFQSDECRCARKNIAEVFVAHNGLADLHLGVAAR
jgi:hypothetical protein